MVNTLKLFNRKKYVTETNHQQIVEIARNNFFGSFNGFYDATIVEMGSVLEGQAYYHESEERYSIIGVEIKYINQLEETSKKEEYVGFFPLWVGKSHPTSPVIFSLGEGQDLGESKLFRNGYGDDVEIKRTVIKKDILQTTAK